MLLAAWHRWQHEGRLRTRWLQSHDLCGLWLKLGLKLGLELRLNTHRWLRSLDGLPVLSRDPIAAAANISACPRGHTIH